MLKDRSSFLEFSICYREDKYKKTTHPQNQQDEVECLTTKHSVSEHFADPQVALACLYQG